MGGAGGWELWECRNCHQSTIPSVFGVLWPNILQCLGIKRCTGVFAGKRSGYAALIIAARRLEVGDGLLINDDIETVGNIIRNATTGLLVQINERYFYFENDDLVAVRVYDVFGE